MPPFPAGFHLLLRRKPKENNFKAVLHSIRELMNTQVRALSGTGDKNVPAAAFFAQAANHFEATSTPPPPSQCVVPEWMHDVFLGYGDPDSAHYRNMPNQIRTPRPLPPPPPQSHSPAPQIARISLFGVLQALVGGTTKLLLLALLWSS